VKRLSSYPATATLPAYLLMAIGNLVFSADQVRSAVKTRANLPLDIISLGKLS